MWRRLFPCREKCSRNLSVSAGSPLQPSERGIEARNRGGWKGKARTGFWSCAGLLCRGGVRDGRARAVQAARRGSAILFAPQIDLDLVIPVQDARYDDDLHDEFGLGAGFRSGEAQDLL